MKKKLLILTVLLCAALLCSCTVIPASKLEAMFRTDRETNISSGSGSEPQSTAAPGTKPAGSVSDTVTISREEYDKYRQFSEMFEIYDFAKNYFYQEPDTDKMTEYAIRGLMNGLDDPYSFYYNPKEYEELWEDDEGNYVGIGVLIQSNMDTQKCTIIRVFKGGPAEAAGVQRGDILYKVGDDLFVNANNLQEAVDIMRGVPDTDVDVTFIRGDEEITYTITRKEVNVNQVESRMIDDSVGYIALYQFAGQCEKEFENDLNKLISQGAKGVIIDLRDNTGGWVDQARYIADLFMDKGELCYLKYRDDEDHTEYLTKDGKVDVKLVILINENTASSSEILTGALRDCAGAVTVGVKSFGKGIIQGVYQVGNKGAGYQMTIAQYYTPNGSAVHKIGITPDFEVSLPEGDNGMYEFADLKRDVQLIKAQAVMNEVLQSDGAVDVSEIAKKLEQSAAATEQPTEQPAEQPTEQPTETVNEAAGDAEQKDGEKKQEENTPEKSSEAGSSEKTDKFLTPANIAIIAAAAAALIIIVGALKKAIRKKE
ncbi:MAG: PDZ domain-containing protein [Clostridiales bacterium]|nr:PDZ domain-containing protein [Clostridiales bacterium]